jgi:hypothetical protein
MTLFDFLGNRILPTQYPTRRDWIIANQTLEGDNGYFLVKVHHTLHCKNGPALTAVTQHGFCHAYYQYGKVYRKHGPAFQCWRPDGTLENQAYDKDASLMPNWSLDLFSCCTN